jgi:tripeptide aminopeptidase
MSPARTGFEQLLKQVGAYPHVLGALRDSLLTNLAMIAEISAPTFEEAERAQFMQTRLAEVGYGDCSIDELGNVAGILANVGDRHPVAAAAEDEEPGTILLVAHLDSPPLSGAHGSVVLRPEAVSGEAVADNALGLAVLASLPTMLEEVGLRPRSQIVAVATSRALGLGDLRGIRFFLENTKLPVRFGVCIEGVQLGRLSFASLGMFRGSIRCSVPDVYDWSSFTGGGAIATLSDVLSKALALRIPTRPRTTIVLGRIAGGTAAGIAAATATVDFEIRSESGQVVASLLHDFGEIVSEVGAGSEADVTLTINARRRRSGLEFAHPLVSRTRRIMQQLELRPRLAPSTGELTAFIDKGVPAITIGMTTGSGLGSEHEQIEITPMYRGMAQLIGIIAAIDQGYCA